MRSGLGSHPWDIQRRYSMPLLCLLFDAEFWANYIPPQPDDPAPGGKGGRPAGKTIDTRKLGDAAFMGLFNGK